MYTYSLFVPLRGNLDQLAQVLFGRFLRIHVRLQQNFLESGQAERHGQGFKRQLRTTVQTSQRTGRIKDTRIYVGWGPCYSFPLSRLFVSLHRTIQTCPQSLSQLYQTSQLGRPDIHSAAMYLFLRFILFRLSLFLDAFLFSPFFSFSFFGVKYSPKSCKAKRETS